LNLLFYLFVLLSEESPTKRALAGSKPYQVDLLRNISFIRGT